MYVYNSMASSLQDLPKRVQYLTVDSRFVNGTNNAFSVDMTLQSNVHMMDMKRVIGLKMVEFYITQVGENDANLNTNVAKYVDVICPDVPKSAQILDERNGLIFARVPLERHFTGSNGIVIRDKQWKSFPRQTILFNPISIQKLNFEIYECQDDGDYVPLQPDASWHMVLEVTTVDVKEKPRDKNLEIIRMLEKLCSKIDTLNRNVKKLPDKPPEKKKKYSFGTLVLILLTILGGYVWWVNRSISRLSM